MRIRRLRVHHFGHFDDIELDLGDEPLVLLAGRNEAGKTTLLQFLRQLLFGFPERTPNHFRAGREVSGAAQLILADGRVVELQRRKGRKNTVQAQLPGHPAVLDDVGFRRLLGNANENVFRTVFAFGLDELRQGNEGLRDESLQAALFGGGLGIGANPEAILKELQGSADSLFQVRGQKPAINELTAAALKLSQDIKDRLVRPETYEEREQAWRAAQQAAAALAGRLHELRTRQARLQQVQKAIPLWCEREQLAQVRSQILLPRGLPADATTRWQELSVRFEQSVKTLRKQQLELQDATAELGRLVVEDAILDCQEEITACQSQLTAIREARIQLPRTRAKLQELERQLQDELTQLRPGWTTEELRLHAPSIADRKQFDVLAGEWESWRKRRTELRYEIEQTRLRLEKGTAELESLPTFPATETLQYLAAEAAEETQRQTSMRNSRQKLARRLRTLQADVLRLVPPLPESAAADWTQLPALPVPSRDILQEWQQRWNRLRQATELNRQRLGDQQTQWSQLRDRWAEMQRAAADYPSRAELVELRAARDTLWQQLWSHFQEPFQPSRVVEAEIYLLAVRQADLAADAQLRGATLVAQREAVQQQLLDQEQALQSATQEYEAAVQELTSLEREWRALWAPCGFEPASPDAMLSWSENFFKFVEHYPSVQELEDDLEAARRASAEFAGRLRAQFGEPEGEPAALQSRLLELVGEERQTTVRRRSLQSQVRDERAQLAELERQQQQSAEEFQEWSSRWQELLTRLELPSNLEVEPAREVLVRLTTAREKLQAISTQDTQAANLERLLKEFAPRVERLRQAVGGVSAEGLPEDQVQAIHHRLTTAVTAAERRQQLRQRCERAQENCRHGEAELADLEKQRGWWFAAAAVSDEASFREVLERAQQARDLEARLQSLAQQIAVVQGMEPSAEFAARLAASDATQLAAELAECEGELCRVEAEEQAARERAGSLRQQFQDLDERHDTALLQEELAQRHAQLAEEVQRYVPLVFARALLEQSIRRFEQSHQPEMLRDVSRLFSAMTAGRYTGLECPAADRSDLFVRRHDGAELAPDQLSTGTREQLYLAIRLAYVQHYCRQAEPLPVVMDDVLVNFDPDRARATLEALRELTPEVQILYFTCHQYMVDLADEVFPGTRSRTLQLTTP